MFWTCKVDGFLILLFVLISINTLTAIGVIRYIKGCQPQHAHHVNKQNICLVIAAVCLCSLFLAGAVTELYVISISFFNFLVPLYLIVFTCASIIRTVNSSVKSSRGGDISERQRKIERNITRVSLILCAAFLLAWSLYAVISMWSAWGYQIPPLNSILASLFAKSASFYNPFIYIGRKDLQTLFYCFRPSSAHRHTPPVPLARPGDVQLDVSGLKEDELVEPNASENIRERKPEILPESECQERPLPESRKSASPHGLIRTHSDSRRL